MTLEANCGRLGCTLRNDRSIIDGGIDGSNHGSKSARKAKSAESKGGGEGDDFTYGETLEPPSSDEEGEGEGNRDSEGGELGGPSHLLVEKVELGSLAHSLGIQAGDYFVGANNEPFEKGYCRSVGCQGCGPCMCRSGLAVKKTALPPNSHPPPRSRSPILTPIHPPQTLALQCVRV